MRQDASSLFPWRFDDSVPAFEDTGHITVMDAKCGLCAKGARWIAHADKAQQFRIIPMQSELGSALLRHFGMDPNDPTSWLYLSDGRAFGEIDGMIRVAQQLGGVWRMLAVLRIMPRGFQAWIYARLARNRYRVFGTGDLCALPDPEVQKRLLQ